MLQWITALTFPLRAPFFFFLARESLGFILGTYCLKKQTKINKYKGKLQVKLKRRMRPWPPPCGVSEGSWATVKEKGTPTPLLGLYGGGCVWGSCALRREYLECLPPLSHLPRKVSQISGVNPGCFRALPPPTDLLWNLGECSRSFTRWGFIFIFFVFGCVACEILVPWPRIKPVPLALGAWSLSHRTTR